MLEKSQMYGRIWMGRHVMPALVRTWYLVCINSREVLWRIIHQPCLHAECGTILCIWTGWKRKGQDSSWTEFWINSHRLLCELVFSSIDSITVFVLCFNLSISPSKTKYLSHLLSGVRRPCPLLLFPMQTSAVNGGKEEEIVKTVGSPGK